MPHMGTLYVVSTPIGNLEDITMRALRVLREVHLIAAEDTRHTRRLLQRYAIDTPCIAYHEHNKLRRLDDILTALANGDVALVSDAGTPTLADPGRELVQACLAAGVAVVPVPGASALLAALAAAGLPVVPCHFLGFLPNRKSERQKVLMQVAQLSATLVCYEAPHRLVASLLDIQAMLGERQIVVARELTKLHEQWLRGRVAEVLEHFQQTAPRGEFTLVIAGAPPAPTRRTLAAATQPDPIHPDPAPSADTLREQALTQMHTLVQQGERSSAAARRVAKTLALPKQVIYQWWLETQADEDDAE